MANPVGNIGNLIPFRPGMSGNPGGRPVAARNRITSRFLYDLADHFQEHGREAIQKVFEEKPDRYLAIVAALLPQKIDLNSPLEGMRDDELDKNLEIIQALRLKLDVAAPSADQP
jgi:hypothetical protein